MLTRARRPWLHSAILLVAIVSDVGCGGGASPSGPGPTSTGGSGATSHLTAIAGQIAIVTVGGLTQASYTSLGAARPSASALVLAGAQSGSVRYQCPLRGQVLIDSLPPFIGSETGPIGVVGVTEEWADCSWSNAGVQYSASGRLVLSGEYLAEGTQAIGVTGSLNTTPGGAAAIDGTITGEASFIGIVGGYQFGCNPCVIVSPPSCSSFDGNYTGRYEGEFSGERRVSGLVAFTVANCAIAVTVPGSGSGAVADSGAGTFSGGLSVGVGCTFTGRFFAGGVAGGGWSCSGDGESGSGRWQAGR